MQPLLRGTLCHHRWINEIVEFRKVSFDNRPLGATNKAAPEATDLRRSASGKPDFISDAFMPIIADGIQQRF
jgi:hypothetical protein